MIRLILPNAKNRKVSFSLNFKLYNFDEVFWNLVDLRENIDERAGLDANAGSLHPYGLGTRKVGRL
jgi:hypothetical protein